MVMKLKNWIYSAGLAATIGTLGWAGSGFSPKPQPKKTQEVTVAFYNLENLFDCVDDPKINDEEFLPAGTNQWTEEKLKVKMANMAKVISKLGDDDGPEILGVCEVENKGVLERLIAEPALKKLGYGIVHHDSPDQRGIDVALLYKKKVFSPLYQKAYPVAFPENPDIDTRDILLVKGILDKSQEVTFVVNHWPSRRGGPEESSYKRERAATVLRGVVDSIFALDKYARLVMMGDFNDEPNNKSIAVVLGAASTPAQANMTHLYNTLYPIFEKGEYGTLMYNKEWDVFDQLIISQALMDTANLVQYVPGSAEVYRPDWMAVQDGDWKGAPKRTFLRKEFQPDGFSDHFPVYFRLSYQP